VFLESGRRFLEFQQERIHGLRGGVQNAQGRAHGSSDADGGRAANDHFAMALATSR